MYDGWDSMVRYIGPIGTISATAVLCTCCSGIRGKKLHSQEAEREAIGLQMQEP